MGSDFLQTGANGNPKSGSGLKINRGVLPKLPIELTPIVSKMPGTITLDTNSSYTAKGCFRSPELKDACLKLMVTLGATQITATPSQDGMLVTASLQEKTKSNLKVRSLKDGKQYSKTLLLKQNVSFAIMQKDNPQGNTIDIIVNSGLQGQELFFTKDIDTISLQNGFQNNSNDTKVTVNAGMFTQSYKFNGTDLGLLSQLNKVINLMVSEPVLLAQNATKLKTASIVN